MCINKCTTYIIIFNNRSTNEERSWNHRQKPHSPTPHSKATLTILEQQSSQSHGLAIVIVIAKHRAISAEIYRTNNEESALEHGSLQALGFALRLLCVLLPRKALGRWQPTDPLLLLLHFITRLPTERLRFALPQPQQIFRHFLSHFTKPVASLTVYSSLSCSRRSSSSASSAGEIWNCE